MTGVRADSAGAGAAVANSGQVMVFSHCPPRWKGARHRGRKFAAPARRDARSRCPVAMPGRDARSRRPVTMAARTGKTIWSHRPIAGMVQQMLNRDEAGATARAISFAISFGAVRAALTAAFALAALTACKSTERTLFLTFAGETPGTRTRFVEIAGAPRLGRPPPAPPAARFRPAAARDPQPGGDTAVANAHRRVKQVLADRDEEFALRIRSLALYAKNYLEAAGALTLQAGDPLPEDNAGFRARMKAARECAGRYRQRHRQTQRADPPAPAGPDRGAPGCGRGAGPGRCPGGCRRRHGRDGRPPDGGGPRLRRRLAGLRQRPARNAEPAGRAGRERNGRRYGCNDPGPADSGGIAGGAGSGHLGAQLLAEQVDRHGAAGVLDMPENPAVT